MGRFVNLIGILHGGTVRVAVQHRDLHRRWRIGERLTSDERYGTCWAIAVSEVIRALLSLTFGIIGLTFGPFSLEAPNFLWYAGELS